MKTNVLFILVLFLSLCAFPQRGVRIAYVDMAYILENVPEYKEANQQLNEKVEKWKIEIEQKKGAIEQLQKNLSVEKVLLTPELIQEREEEIHSLEKEMVTYQQNRFGPQGDLVVQKKLLVQPVQDQVFNLVQEIAASRKYDFVFDKSADVVMLYSDKRNDISDLILRSINQTKKQEERKAKAVVTTVKQEKQPSEKQKLQPPAETENPVDTEAMIQEENVAEKPSEEKVNTVEEKKQQKIAEREERKKAYEERKKKLLEEREAARKAKLEDRQKKTLPPSGDTNNN